MVDLAEWTAIALGTIAVGIAAWDDLRDRYFSGRRQGPVDARLEIFDIPQPNVLLHSVGPAEARRDVRGTEVRIGWSIWNHVSWPVYVTFPYRSTLGIQTVLGETVRDELLEDKGGSAMYVPPRQPVHRTIWLTLAVGSEGTITPQVCVFTKGGQTIAPETKRLRWLDGLPILE